LNPLQANSVPFCPANSRRRSRERFILWEWIFKWRRAL
jgi:hypothetical protein